MTLPMEGLTVVVTGDVPGMDRDQAEAAAVRLGARTVKSVSGKTGLLIAGTGAGASKMDKARQHGVRVLDADAFAALAADPERWDEQPLGTPQDEPAAPPPNPPYVRPEHPVSRATGHLDGAWTTRIRCACGWEFDGQAGQASAAVRAHRPGQADGDDGVWS